MAQHYRDPLVGQVIDDRYEILQRIGEGGMGVVYKARQVSIDRVVAIKMLNQEMAQDPTWVQRFYNEAKACSQLQHPNTIRMFEFGQTRDGRLFMAMEFLDGKSLAQVVAEEAPLHPARVIKTLIQCCASLAEAHAVGIIHRDIKPDNVFLLRMAGSPDFVKLLDFSVAKLLQENDRMRTQAGVVFGTPQYMSPEQGRGIPLDARSDLYALGVLAYEMLVGRVPFNHENPMLVLQMHVRQPVPALPPQIPLPVQHLVMRALDKEPARRYQSAGEMMQHCQQIAAQLEGGGAMPPGVMPPGVMPPGPPGGVPGAYGGGPPSMGGGGSMGGGRFGGSAQMAGGGQMAGMGNQQAPRFLSSDAAAKTIIAGQAPPPNVQGFVNQQVPADAKTVIASVSPMAQQQRAPGYPEPLGYVPGPTLTGQGQAPQAPTLQEGPQKTVLLQNSEGIVSFAQQQAASAQQVRSAAPPTGVVAPVSQPPVSALYWAVCLLSGLAVGVIAYLVVLMLS